MRLGSVSSSDMWARPSMRRMVAAITPPPADTAPSARRAGAAVAAAIAGAGAGALPSKVASAWRNMSRWWRSRSSASRNEAAASARPSSSASRIMRGSVTSISCISPVAAVTRFSRVDATAPIARRCSRAWIVSAPAASKNSWATSARPSASARIP